ncbi:MAG: glycosyltransferase family 2 protein [Lachnospiraceae bacterium]|nr:glycosyltransferase family 2 protein [Lachnospiraceae bacterium]
MGSDSVDVIIPVYKPDERFLKVLRMLSVQDVRPQKIILMNTEEAFWNSFAANAGDLPAKELLEIHHIAKKDFNHGGTRDLGASYSGADHLLFMTQDALPKDRSLIGKLLQALRDKDVAVSYARQLPPKNCSPIERYNRVFNYPDRDIVKGASDLQKLGIKTFFCSNVCACYDRRIFDSLGGFVKNTIFNEDMIYASKAVRAGYRISYASKACVYHSHDYSMAEQFHRNFDLGVSQAEHPEAFRGISSEKEGKKLVLGSISYLKRQGKLILLPDFILKYCARYAGYLLGANYRRLPRWVVLKSTTNPEYFKNL